MYLLITNIDIIFVLLIIKSLLFFFFFFFFFFVFIIFPFKRNYKRFYEWFEVTSRFHINFYNKEFITNCYRLLLKQIN